MVEGAEEGAEGDHPDPAQGLGHHQGLHLDFQNFLDIEFLPNDNYELPFYQEQCMVRGDGRVDTATGITGSVSANFSLHNKQMLSSICYVRN